MGAPRADAAYSLQARRDNTRRLIALGQQLVTLVQTESKTQPALAHADHTYQLLDGHNLVALSDGLQSKVALRIGCPPAAIASARWVSRPAGASSMPSGFEGHPRILPIWLYSQALMRQTLPAALAQGMLYLDQMPALPIRYLKDRQVKLMECLSTHPTTLTEMVQRHPSVVHRRLTNDLLGLYWAGALTVTPRIRGASSG